MVWMLNSIYKIRISDQSFLALEGAEFWLLFSLWRTQHGRHTIYIAFVKTIYKCESFTPTWFGQKFLPILILPARFCVFFFSCLTDAWFKLKFLTPYFGFWEWLQIVILDASTNSLRHHDWTQGNASMCGQDNCRTPADKPISLIRWYFVFPFLSCSLNTYIYLQNKIQVTFIASLLSTAASPFLLYCKQ